MRRREFIAGLGGAAVWPVAVRAQQARMPVIGYVYPLSREARPEFLGAFHRGLAKTGFIEGRNVAIEYRWGDGNYDLLPSLLADLIRRQVDVIAAPSVAAGLLKATAPTVPIVFAVGADPVELGLAASLNRPGGNFTGSWALSAEVMAKRVQLLHELVPAAATFGFLVNQGYPNLAEIETKEAQFAAGALGLRLLVLNASSSSEIEVALKAMAEQRIGGFLVNTDPLLAAARAQVVAAAARFGLPAIFHLRDAVEGGGLMSYGANLLDAFRLVGEYTGRILRGEKPAEMPVERSTKIELIINLKTAKALGLTVPITLLGRADEVIE